MSALARPTADQDRALLRQAQQDPDTRPALVDRFSPLVWSLCRRLSQTPEDSFQAAWARLLGRLDSYDPQQAAPSTWITTVVHRMLIDEYRRRGRMGDVLPMVDRAAVTVDPADLLDRHRQVQRLEAALQRLPDNWRRVVILHHLHGVPLATLADEEDIAVGTVKSRLHRGRARLAQILGAQS
ncbi:MAG: sigma-70 family RNA polymerase sigma factor [Oligoflexia bacterium]|nr:sigma-70 family RNA polymerase sigma factor [Oligoflexia bacterium]